MQKSGRGVRAVIDTNVLVSGLLWGGPPGQLLLHVWRDRLTLVISLALLDELEDVLSRRKFAAQFQATHQSPRRLIERIRLHAFIPSVETVERVVAADPDDDTVLACAVAGNADAIVSGDRHLLALGSYRDIPILTVVALLERLEG